jgi:branched-chain amino acid transport system ATP-binding protein
MSAALALADAPLLEVRNLTKRFAGLVAVSDVSFAVAPGEMISLIGPNGAGKTTLFNLLTGQLRPTAGTVSFAGAPINALGPHRRARLGMGRTFQIARPMKALSVLENVMIGAFLHRASLVRAEEKAETVLDKVGLLSRARLQAGALTLSECRRLEVARALALDPQIILLDEVMAGLNPSEVNMAIELYQGLNREGLTFLVIEHNLKVVRAFAERVIVLDHGIMIGAGTATDILHNPAVIEAYVGRGRS